MAQRIWVVEIPFDGETWEPDIPCATKREADKRAKELRLNGWETRVRAYEPVPAVSGGKRKAGRR